VAGALEEIIGYRFNEFVESFYLAQREITTPHPHSHAVKAMAGIFSLERVGDLLQGEVDDARDEIPEVSGQLETVLADIEGLRIDPKKLESLKSQTLAVGGAGEILRTRAEDLESASSEYQAALESLASARRARKIWRILAGIAFLAAIALGVAWYVLSKTPDSVLATKISEVLAWGDRPVYQLGLGSETVAAIAIALLLMGGLGTQKIASLIRSGETLADLVEGSGKPVPGIPAEDQLVDEGTDLDALRACRLNAPGATALVSSANARIAKMLEAQRENKARISALIDTEKALHAKADALGGVADRLREKIDGARRIIEVREAAAELITGASRHISQRFNRDLRDLASGTLPLLTEGRYEHLQIDTDLEVQVFSSQKRDFMELDEISSGTQRQIMLAVRLALSQELVNTTGTKKQFLFLDEPFAFFDPTRARNAMAALPDLSDEICQIWVIAQEFPENTARDLAIECARKIERLNEGDGNNGEEAGEPGEAEGEEDPAVSENSNR